MRRVSWPGVVVVAASTVVSWLAGGPRVATSSTATSAAKTAPANTSAPGAALVLPELELHDWTRRAATKDRPTRDIFAFHQPVRPAAPTAPAEVPRLFAAQADGPRGSAVPTASLFKLIGFAEDAGADGAPERTAIISGQGQLYLVKTGDTVAVMYRVGTIGPDAVELIDQTGGPAVQLRMK